MIIGLPVIAVGRPRPTFEFSLSGTSPITISANEFSAKKRMSAKDKKMRPIK
jgi:hypothetical protein